MSAQLYALWTGYNWLGLQTGNVDISTANCSVDSYRTKHLEITRKEIRSSGVQNNTLNLSIAVRIIITENVNVIMTATIFITADITANINA